MDCNSASGQPWSVAGLPWQLTGFACLCLKEVTTLPVHRLQTGPRAEAFSNVSVAVFTILVNLPRPTIILVAQLLLVCLEEN